MLIRPFARQAVAVMVAVAGALCTAPFAAAAPQNAVPQKFVAITAIIEHPSLDAVRDGVQSELKAAGYTPGKNLRWEYQNAQGNTATAAQIARHFVGESPDVIVAISTPSAQAMVATTKQIPIVYAAITDPVAAQLVPSMQHASGTNVTGVSDALSMEKQIALIKKVVPNVKRVGMIYNPGEANSVAMVRQMETLLPRDGISFVGAAALRTVDVAASARSLVGKVDVIYTGTDNNVVAAYESLVKVADEAKVPLVAADTNSVRRGAIAAQGVNYHDLGMQVGRIVVRILQGEQVGTIPSEVIRKVELSVSPAAAKNEGVTLSPSLLNTAVPALP